MHGPYLPLYGCGLVLLFLIARIPLGGISPVWVRYVVLLAIICAVMTLIEYIAGLIFIKGMGIKLWDYSAHPGNIQGIICPLFSFFWAALGAAYYFLVHPYILNALAWLSNNLAFSFFIGMFFGVFIIDVVHSSQIIVKLKKFAEDNDVIVRYEALKTHIRQQREERSLKYHFFRPFRTERPLAESLREMQAELETRIRRK